MAADLNSRRGGGLVVALLLAAVAILAVLLWRQGQRVDRAERQEGLDATRMVAEVFQGKRDLRVGQLSGVVIARSEHDGFLFHPTQLTRAPATVNYFLPLKRIGRGDLNWDPAANTMTVRIPDVTVEAPAIDMARSEVLDQKGLWIGRKVGTALQQQAAQRIVVRAAERGRAPENLARARQNAVAGVTTMVRQPLEAAGLPPVKVRVLFPWQGGAPGEQWDRSRSPAEVLANAS